MVDPYLVISTVDPKGGQTEVIRTEVVKKSRDPVWKTVSLPLPRLTGGDIHNSIILLECFDYEAVGKNEIIGKVQVTD